MVGAAPPPRTSLNLFYQHIPSYDAPPLVPSLGIFQSFFPDIVLKILSKLFKLLLINKCFI